MNKALEKSILKLLRTVTGNKKYSMKDLFNDFQKLELKPKGTNRQDQTYDFPKNNVDETWWREYKVPYNDTYLTWGTNYKFPDKVAPPLSDKKDTNK